MTLSTKLKEIRDELESWRALNAQEHADQLASIKSDVERIDALCKRVEAIERVAKKVNGDIS